jgi:molecular chaperone DnaK (HSP70)
MGTNYIGIDLGTTESTVSIIEMKKMSDKPMNKLKTLDVYQYNSQHELDKNLKGLASTIYVDRDSKKVYTGEYAKTLYASGNRPLNTIRSVKTRIGGESMIDIPLEKDRSSLKSYDMTELTAILLKSIKSSIDKQIDGSIDEVTITIPAAFNSDERNATIEAGKMVGFKDINLLDEPTAVLLNFLNSEDTNIDSTFFDKPKNIVVYDIGGGTLDISIAKVQDIEMDFNVEILGRSKRMDFGGDDIDKYIGAYFLKEFEINNQVLEDRSLEEQAIIISRILSNAEKSKISFSKKISKHIDNQRRRTREKESINFEIIDNLKVTDLTLTDERVKEILSELISSTGLLLKPLKESLKISKLKSNEIDLVILTGGSGKFYLIEELLREFFVNVQIVEFTQNNAVSVGAAIHSFNQNNEKLKKINIDDVMSDSIYIKKSKKSFDKLIPHNQNADTKGTYQFEFESSLDRLEVFLYYGSDNEQKYEYKEITGIFKKLDRTYTKGEKIQLDWHFDENRTIKLYFNGEELVNSDKKSLKNSELINQFKLM